MWWLWGTIGIALAAMFVAAWFYDRRHGKNSSFGDGTEGDPKHVDALNAARIARPGEFNRQ